MTIKKILLPEGYVWEDNGLMKLSKNMKKRIANAYPNVFEVLEIEDDMGNIEKYILLGYCIAGQEKEVEATKFPVDKIKNGKFFEELPIEVIVEPGCKRSAKDVFQNSIKEQLMELPVSKKKIYHYGWNGNKFCMGDSVPTYEIIPVPMEKVYESAGHLLKILIHPKSGVIGVLVLAVMHGPLKKLLEAAKIAHDFVTFIVGETGTGKTDATKKICKIPGAGEYVFSVISDRKVIKQILANKSDMTIVLDDYCNSDSGRITEKLKQTMSEIIQAACDAGRDVTDASVVNREGACIHIVMTGEKMFGNLSTMNRIFPFQMEKSLPDELYESLKAYTEEKMSVFMQGLFSEIGENWEEEVTKVHTDYELFFEQAKNECVEMGSSAKRIANTMAVQRTIWKILMDYFCKFGFDGKTLDIADQQMQMVINVCIRNLTEEIRKIKGEKDHKRYLSVMAQILYETSDGYSVAHSEKKYLKHVDRPYKGKTCVGACLRKGYWSILPSHLCSILSEQIGEEVTPKKISIELQRYRLAHVDSEDKLSNRWLSNKRMYHIDIASLCEVVRMQVSDSQVEHMDNMLINLFFGNYVDEAYDGYEYYDDEYDDEYNDGYGDGYNDEYNDGYGDGYDDEYDDELDDNDD